MAKVISSTLILLVSGIVHVQSSNSGLDQPFTESYSRLDHAPCVSLFYRNGRLGCGTSDYSLQIGKLEYFDGESIPNSRSEFVAVMEDYMLYRDSLSLLKSAHANGKLQGVLVLNSTSSNAQDHDSQWYSPEAMYPLGYGTPSAALNYGNYKYDWNGKGSGINNQDLHGLPMAYVKDSSVSNTLRQESQDSSVDSDIVGEFNYYMGPEGMNSIECLSWTDSVDGEWRPKCLPLGGSSVWAAAGLPPPDANNQNGRARKPVFLIGASMDSTGIFHDLVPGANTAATNILTLLMAAKLIGDVGDKTLSKFNSQIVFGFFQAEAQGFVGSRAFFRDMGYPGFQCNHDPVRTIPRLDDQSEYACLDPLYPSLKFANLGQMAGMLSIDQVGVPSNGRYFYSHADQNNDKYGSFLSSILKQLYTQSGYKVVETSSSSNNGNGYPYPPTPLTSLLSLSEGAVGGAVFTGYDAKFSTAMPYHSFKESASFYEINLNAIAAAATIIARAAVAAAYDVGDYDYQTDAQYASQVIPELESNDGALLALSKCLLYNGECSNLRKYASVRAANERARSGFSVDDGVSLGVPPNYYVGVYNAYYGQPFVQVGEKRYGRYDGMDFGKSSSDAIAQQPTMLENAVHGLLDDFLGRGAYSFEKKSCKKESDCENVDFCIYEEEFPTCTGGGICVCSRANFHRALDEGLEAAENKPTGYFVVSDNDAGISPMFTEPYWSNEVGVRVYRDVGPLPGLITLVAGAAGMATSLCAAFLVRVGLKKEKLY